MKKKLPYLIFTFVSIFSLFHQNTFAWFSVKVGSESENTHCWLLNRSINLIKSSKNCGIDPLEIKLITAWHDQLEKGVHQADWSCFFNSFYSYGCHYYNPRTKCSFIPTTTASEMCTNLFQKAGDLYLKGDLKNAFFHLGLSLHYISDLTQPMHVVHLTDFNLSMPTYHYQFEKLAAKIQEKYALTGKMQFELHKKQMNPAYWIETTALESEIFFQLIVNKKIKRWFRKSFFLKKYDKKWKDELTPIIGDRLMKTQKLLAIYIHLWFKTYVLEKK